MHTSSRTPSTKCALSLDRVRPCLRSQLIAANAETERLRIQLRQVATAATTRVKALQIDLQSELNSMQDELGIASLQMSILCQELEREEEQRREAFQIEQLQIAVRIRVRNSRGCRRAMHDWCSWSRNRQLVSQLLPEKRAMRQALGSWKELQRFRVTALRAITSLQRRGERRALASWMGFTYLRSTRLSVMALTIVSLRRRPERLALNAWMRVLGRDATRLRRRLVASLRAWQGGGVHRAWRKWNAVRLAAEKCRAAANCLLQSGCKQALNTWRATISSRHGRMRRRLRGCLTSLASLVTRRALNSWIATSRKESLLGVALAGWVQRGERRSLTAWRKFVDHALYGLWMGKVKDAQLRRAVAAWVQRGERRALSSWIYLIDVRSEVRRILAHAIAAFCHQGIRRALNAWMAHMDRRARVRRMLISAILEWQGTGSRRAFHSWRARVLEREQRRSWLRGYLASLARTTLRRALNSWTGTLWNATLEVRATPSATLVTRAISAWVQSGERRALNSWLEFLQRLAAMRFILAQSVESLRCQNLRQAVRKWTERAVSRKSTRHMVLAAVLAWCGSGARRALKNWKACTKGITLINYALLVWIRHGQLRAFESWLYFLRARLGRLSRSTALVYQPRLRLALNAWTIRLRAITCFRRKVLFAVRRFQHERRADTLWHACASWRSWAHARCSRARNARDRQLRIMKLSLCVWFRVHVASTVAQQAHRVLQRRLNELKATISSQQLELSDLHELLASAREAASSAVVHASSAIESADERVLRNERSMELKCKQIELEITGRLGQEFEERRSRLIEEHEQAIALAKQQWETDGVEYDRDRDLNVNSMRLRLYSAQANACLTLLDKEQQKDSLLYERFATPTQALHSLIARGRPVRQAGSPRPRPGRHPSSPFVESTHKAAVGRREG